METSTIYSTLKKEDAVFLSVPTSGFKGLLSFLEQKGDITYCSNEEEVLGIGAGLALCSKTPIALMQSSGFGKIANVYFSLNKLYDLPILFLIDVTNQGRNTPERLYIGQNMIKLLKVMGLQFRKLDGSTSNFSESIKYALEAMSNGESFAFLIGEGVIDG